MGDTDWLREQGFDDPTGEKDPGQMLIEHVNRTERFQYSSELRQQNRSYQKLSSHLFANETFTKNERSFTRQRTMGMTGNIEMACCYASYEYYLINQKGDIAKFIFSSFKDALDFTKNSYKSVLIPYNTHGEFSVVISIG